MNSMVPAIWKSSLDRIRGGVSGLIDKWFDKPRHPEEIDQWSPSLFSVGPHVDVEEDDKEILVKVELPGLERDDFELEVDRGNLVIRGEKSVSQKLKKGSVRYAECCYGSFRRVVPLPCQVEEDKIKATYRNGVLAVRLPKSAEARQRRIKVSAA